MYYAQYLTSICWVNVLVSEDYVDNFSFIQG